MWLREPGTVQELKGLPQMVAGTRYIGWLTFSSLESWEIASGPVNRDQRSSSALITPTIHMLE